MRFKNSTALTADPTMARLLVQRTHPGFADCRLPEIARITAMAKSESSAAIPNDTVYPVASCAKVSKNCPGGIPAASWTLTGDRRYTAAATRYETPTRI